MKINSLFIVMLAAMLTAGCVFHRHQSTGVHPSPVAAKPIVTPDFSLAAKVVAVNPVGRFVILNFPVRQLPKRDQTLFTATA